MQFLTLNQHIITKFSFHVSIYTHKKTSFWGTSMGADLTGNVALPDPHLHLELPLVEKQIRHGARQAHEKNCSIAINISCIYNRS